MFPCPLYRNEKQVQPDIGLNQAGLTGMYTREALKFIEDAKNGPFFLYFAHTFPHQPLFAHEAIFFYHYDLLEGVRVDQWKYFRKMNRYAWPIPLDAATVPDRLGKSQLGSRWPLLYNLSFDPSESYNVISTYPAIGEKMHARLIEWDQRTQKNPRGFFIQ